MQQMLNRYGYLHIPGFAYPRRSTFLGTYRYVNINRMVRIITSWLKQPFTSEVVSDIRYATSLLTMEVDVTRSCSLADRLTGSEASVQTSMAFTKTEAVV